MRTYFFFFFLGLTPLNFPNLSQLSEFSGQTFRILIKFPNFFRIFRMSFPNFWLLSEFSSTFRILVYVPNFGRKWTRNRVPRFPLFSNSGCYIYLRGALLLSLSGEKVIRFKLLRIFKGSRWYVGASCAQTASLNSRIYFPDLIKTWQNKFKIVLFINGILQTKSNWKKS